MYSNELNSKNRDATKLGLEVAKLKNKIKEVKV